MRRPKTYSTHDCAPEEWRNVPDMTGNAGMDAYIIHNPNKDMADRLKNHLSEDVAYKINTGYGRGTVG